VSTAPFRCFQQDSHYLPPSLTTSPHPQYHAVTNIHDRYVHNNIQANVHADRGSRTSTAPSHSDHATRSSRPRADYFLATRHSAPVTTTSSRASSTLAALYQNEAILRSPRIQLLVGGGVHKQLAQVLPLERQGRACHRSGCTEPLARQ
jgi:hypothetical protein